MKTFAEFQIIGRVGQVKTVGKTRRVTIAAEYGRVDDNDEFNSNPFWNEVTIFNEGKFGWIDNLLNPGDIVHARGTIRQTSFEKDGQTIYGVTLAANDFDRLAEKKQRYY